MTIPFPAYTDSAAATKIAELRRLMDRTLTNSDYIDGLSASRLLATFLQSYRALEADATLSDEPLLNAARADGRLFGLVLAAVFDSMCNAEYLHGRMANNRWTYCHRKDEPPKAYYSFLKQCPTCCLDVGLAARIERAQHKPTSHHIGEITTVATALLLQLIAAANAEPFEVATITKQSHDVDAIGFREDLLVLFEVKASPMVTYPLVARLTDQLRQEDADGQGAREYEQHSLIDYPYEGRQLALSVPHRGVEIPLGEANNGSWPYDPLIKFFSAPVNLSGYLSAWLELYEAYRVPKKVREGRQERIAYLVNGWGDEIDSNKTKPGLGRTDDVKKGTYQLLKFGAYYRDNSARTRVRGALVANLDPLFLRGDYID